MQKTIFTILQGEHERDAYGFLKQYATLLETMPNDLCLVDQVPNRTEPLALRSIEPIENVTFDRWEGTIP